MSLKRECDRCLHLTNADSLNANEMRVVHIERGATASSNGGTSMVTVDYDLCKQCVIELQVWMTHTASNETRPLSEAQPLNGAK